MSTQPNSFEPYSHPDDEELLNPEQVAKKLGVSVGWVHDHAAPRPGRKARRQPVIPVVRMGSDQRSELRFQKQDIRDFIRRNRFDGTTQTV